MAVVFSVAKVTPTSITYLISEDAAAAAAATRSNATMLGDITTALGAGPGAASPIYKLLSTVRANTDAAVRQAVQAEEGRITCIQHSKAAGALAAGVSNAAGLPVLGADVTTEPAAGTEIGYVDIVCKHSIVG